jgi:hypothetical protein
MNNLKIENEIKKQILNLLHRKNDFIMWTEKNKSSSTIKSIIAETETINNVIK